MQAIGDIRFGKVTRYQVAPNLPQNTQYTGLANKSEGTYNVNEFLTAASAAKPTLEAEFEHAPEEIEIEIKNGPANGMADKRDALSLNMTVNGLPLAAAYPNAQWLKHAGSVKSLLKQWAIDSWGDYQRKVEDLAHNYPIAFLRRYVESKGESPSL